MPTIIIPGRAARGKRPRGNFSLNADCAQAQGLLFWAGLQNGTMRDMAQGTPLNHAINGVPCHDFRTGAAWRQPSNNGGTLTKGSTQNVTNFPAMNTPYTICLWATLMAASPSGTDFLMGFGNTTAKTGYGITYIPGGGQGFAAQNISVSTFAPLPTFGLASFVVAVYPGSGNGEIYLNGVRFENNTQTVKTDVPDRAGMGYQFQNDNFGFSGLNNEWAITDGRVYTRALKAGEIVEMTDPSHWWDLYWTPSATRYFFIGGADVPLAPSFASAQITGQAVSMGFAINMPDEL